MKLIGISGLKTAGKDSTYRAIAAALPELSVQRVGFADKLKIIAARALGFEMPDEDCIAFMNECKESWSFAIHPSPYASDDLLFTGRQYLQWLGGQARFVFGDTFLVDQILPMPSKHYEPDTAERANCLTLKEFYPGVDVLCITDVRFFNEAERILELGGEIWNVERPGTTSDGHDTEIPINDGLIDHHVLNTGTLEELQNAVSLLI